MISKLISAWNVVGKSLLHKSSASTILVQSAVPVIYIQSGTVATNGTLTVLTALPATYSSGAWVRLPAGAVVGGSAGMYWCVFSSTTTGAVKTNFIDPETTVFNPSIPVGTLTSAVGSNLAYVQTTASTFRLTNYTVTGRTMGANGVLRITPTFTFSGGLGAKVVSSKFGTLITTTTTSAALSRITGLLRIANRGESNQIATPSIYGGLTTTTGIQPANSALLYGTVDTTADNTLAITVNSSNVGDSIVLEELTVELLSA